MGTVAALGLSSVLPAVRTVWAAVGERTVNALAALILVVNVVGLALSVVTGDARLMLVKDSAVSSTVGIGVLVALLFGRPLMSAGLKPWITKGEPARTAAWDRLSVASARFRRAEKAFSLIWGTALLAECVTRVIAVYSVPVDTMVWFGNVIMGVFVAAAVVVGGAVAARPIQQLVAADAAGAPDSAPGSTFESAESAPAGVPGRAAAV